jgi:cobyrinic acid a,c-diamide synthase
MKSQFLLAAAHSGAGKTTVTLGLLRALQRKGHRVQPFKCGPDYIDPIHHRAASGRDSINLDLYMMSDAHIRALYDRHGSAAGICITEGVMGLFDGARKREGSSADIARMLGLPVILVLNAKAMAYSAAAILYGLKHFDPGVRIAGVIFNFVETASHYRLLQEACEDVGVTALGHLPVNSGLRIPSRHLGLDTADAEGAIGAAADHMEKYVDLEELVRLTASVGSEETAGGSEGAAGGSEEAADGSEGDAVRGGEEVRAASGKRMAAGRRGGHRTILVARDAAFHFLYPENIRRLEEWGNLHYFSPLQDERLPVAADLIYLPGGYPELYLDKLAANTGLLDQIRSHYVNGRQLLAECGGMMYLGQAISDESGKPYTMAGLLDLATSIEHKKLSMGYRSIGLDGQTIKGHEFHYSQLVDRGAPGGAGTRMSVDGGARMSGVGSARMPADCAVYNVRGEKVETPVYYSDRLLASYMHLYWGEETGLVEKWLH